jgi:hypothetical protein
MSITEKLAGLYEEHLLQEFQAAWCLQDKPTRKHRLTTVMALSVALDEIKKVDIFSTAFGEQVIEAVIQGDWREVEEVTSYLTFDVERQELRDKYKPLWERFRTLALTACAEEKRRVPGQRMEAH